jgi:hypothetical protein
MATGPDETQQLLAEGQAALMIAESLLLLLVETKLVDKERLVDAIETVIAAKRSMIADGTAPEVSAAAVGLLSSIANSLTAAGDSPAPPPSSEAQSRRRRG